MKWMQWIIYAGMVTLWAASGTADATENANGGAPGAWDQQLQSRDLTGKRGQEQVDLHTGSFNYSIPINCAPARNGSQPALALTYTSGAENGWCGMGWRLDLGYIERNTKDGFPIQYTTAAIPMPATAYDDTKGFLLNLYGKESKLYAVATNSPTVEYRAETDTEFLRCLLNTNNNNWTVYDKSGNAYHFGQSSSSRVSNPKTGWSGYSGTFHWGLDEVDSATGDQTTVAYTTYNDPVMSSLPERTIYPSTITYNGHTNCNGYTTVASGNGTISFATEIRPDQRNSYRWGFRAEQNRRLTNIVCKVGSQKVWRYALGYTTSTATGRSLLSSVTTYGSDDSTALPVQTFTYQQNPNGVSFGSTMAWTNMILSDLSGAGGTDPCLTQINDSETTIADLFDIDGDGLPDRVSYCYGGGSSSDTYQVQHNNGVGGFGARYTFGPASSSSSSTASDANLVPASGVYSALNGLNTRLHDINGDGLPDRINDWWKHYDSSGLYQYTNFVVMTNTGNGFGSAYLWPLATNDMAYDQNNYMSVIDAGPTEAWAGLLDINGDGLPDRVMGLYNQPTTYFKVQYNTGTGFAPVKYFGPLRSQNYTNATSGNAWAAVPQSADSMLIDLNGDGLPDHVMMPMSSLGAQLSASADTYFAVEFNDGYSFESTNTSTAVPGAADIWSGVNPEPNNSGFQAIQNAPYVGMYDLNGDGLPDRVMLNPTNMYSANPSWLVYLNNGRGFNSVPILVSNIDNQGEYSTSYIPCWGAMEGTLESSVATMLIDINGDGLLDRVMNVFNGDTSDPGVSTTANYFLVQLNDGPFPDLLTNVNNGMGGNYAITYLPSTTYNNHLDANDSSSGSVLPFIYQTVATVTESDGVNAARTTAYGYAGGYYNGPRREFHGFAAVSVTNPPSPISASYDRVTVHYYHQGGGQDHSTIGEYGDAGAFAKDGMEYRTESYGNDGNLYHVTVNQINQTYLGNGRYFPYVQQTFECDYVPGGTNRVTATQLAYDLTTGNLTNKIIYGEVTGFSPSSVGSFSFNDATTADNQYQSIYYASLSGNSYIVDHPSKISLADASGNVFQEEDYTYDPTSGAPTTKLALITAGYYATNSYGNYDTYGLATLATDPVGVQTVLGYDSTYTFQTTKHLRATPGSDSSSDLTTTNYYDARSGLVTNSTAITGVSVTNAYDALYRLTASGRIAVGGSSVWMKRVSYNLGSISSGAAVSYLDETDNDGVGGVETRTYVDGFDRPIQERIQGENSNFRVVSVAYDELGKIFLTTWPSFGSSATFAKPSSQTAVWIGYDAAGRVATNRLVTATFNSAGAFSSKTDLGGDTGSLLGAKTWNYANGSDPWWVVFTDEDSKVRRYGLDAFGRTNQIQEVNGSTYYTTTLKYNVAGDLTNIVNANSENIYFAYNDLGDVVAMADPNLGQWTYVRDYAGRVRLQTDARENVVSNSYINPSTSYQDPAGRLRVQTVFGTNYTNHVLMPAFTNTYAYDASDNGNFTVCKGLLYKVTDSEGAETNGYDSLGRLTNSVRHLNMNGENYTTSYSYNDGDKLTSTVYPNGGPTVTNLYFTGGSLKQVSRSGGTELYYTVSASAYDQFGHATNFAYGNGLSTTLGYYPISERLENISCGSSGAVFNRTYTYSAANDILTIVGTGITNSGNTVTVTYDNLHRVKTYTGLTGSYGYDVVGTMTTNIETGNAQTYAFGVRRPQAVRSAFATTNLYDLCGNMIVRQAGLTNSQSLVYDAENRLVRFSQATTNLLLVKFGYSADGARLWKWDNQAATNLQVWIGNIYEEKKGKVLYHVYAGGQQVCSFETNSTLFGGSDTNRVAYYYHEDDLNSSTALSSGGSSGSQIEVNAYYPFGRVMTASPQASFKVSRQFTGQVKDDDTGLYYYNARYYDPLLGRFIQADTTIPDLGNPQSYNRYSYCLNNPLSYNDPSGHDPAFTPGMSMYEGLSVQQRYTASRAALPATVGMTVAAASGGVAAPLLVSVGASAGFAAVGSGLIAGATGDLAAQGTQIGLGQRQSISGQQVAVSSLAGGALNGAVGKLASLKGTPEPEAAPQVGPYSHLEDHPSVGPGKDFTQAQKRNILNANRAQNGGTLRSDESGTQAVAPLQSKKGITPPSNEAHVDHIEPKAKGGSNSYKNAQVLTREENLKKSDN